MKGYVLALLLFCFSVELAAQKTLYVRVYDLDGKKVSKGRVREVTDSSLLLKAPSAMPSRISRQDIGMIRTRRSAGHNMLVGAIAGTAILGPYSAAKADSGDWFYFYGPKEGFAFGALAGAGLGVAASGITILLKGSKKFNMKESQEAWQEFQKYAEAQRLR